VIFAEPPGGELLQKRRSALCWNACVARTVSTSCAAVRGQCRSLLPWSKEFLEAGKKRLCGDTQREVTSGEVKDLRGEAAALKEALARFDLSGDYQYSRGAKR